MSKYEAISGDVDKMLTKTPPHKTGISTQKAFAVISLPRFPLSMASGLFISSGAVLFSQVVKACIRA